MEPNPHRLRDAAGDEPPRDSGIYQSVEAFTADELDALEKLAEFEAEHRRILAMQTLYYKRRKAGGVA
jgi:hypothetical protein